MNNTQKTEAKIYTPLRIWWWFGYHGLYQIHWFLIKHNLMKGLRKWLMIQ